MDSHKHDYKAAPPLEGTGKHQQQRPNRRPPYTEEVKARHEESAHKYPRLTLSKEEYVIEAVRRHPIGLFFIWLFVGVMAVVILSLLSLYGINHAQIEAAFAGMLTLPSAIDVAPLVFIGLAFMALGGIIATIVYQGNRFYLTNEAVFQYLQTGLLTTKTQVINLINVEDASHDQVGILQQLFNYGTLRLSTQGEETIYRFLFVANPGRIVGLVNDAVENAIRINEGLPPTEH